MSDAKSLHQKIVAISTRYRSIKHELAVLLAEMAQGLYAELGYASITAYGYRELDLSVRQVRALICLGRRLPEFPELQRAFAEGVLPWTKARELLRVITPDTEKEWIERAQASNSRQLENLVASAVVGDRPDPNPDPKGPPRRRVFLVMDAQDADLLYAAIAKVRQSTGLNADELEDGAIVAQIMQRSLHDELAHSGGPTRETTHVGHGGTVGHDARAGHTTPTKTTHPPSAERYRIVLEHCPRCRRTSGIHDEVNSTHVGHAMCDAEVQDGGDGPTRGHLSRTIPPATRRAVIHRDRWCCAVPHCTNTLWLDLHHVRERHNGGDHREANLVTLCGSHHRAIHEGLLSATHHPKGGVRFEFGDGRVLVSHRRRSRMPRVPPTTTSAPTTSAPTTTAASTDSPAP